jgi:hypothetical protein
MLVSLYSADSGYRLTSRYTDTLPRTLNHIVSVRRSFNDPLQRVRRIRTHIGTVTVLTFERTIFHVQWVTVF